MDPITLAPITAGVTVLAPEAGKGLAGEAGKSAWEKFGWGEEPETTALASSIAQELQARPEMARDVVELLQQPRIGVAQQLIGTINAERVVVANVIRGGIQM